MTPRMAPGRSALGWLGLAGEFEGRVLARRKSQLGSRFRTERRDVFALADSGVTVAAP